MAERRRGHVWNGWWGPPHPLLSHRQAMTPQYCPEKVVKTFAISSELTAVNSWPCLDQWAGVGPHWAKMEPLNQLSRGRRHRRILPVALRVCGDSCVADWGLETVAEIQNKLAYISVDCNVFTKNNLKSISHFVFNMNKSPQLINGSFSLSEKVILKCYTWKVTLVFPAQLLLIKWARLDVSHWCILTWHLNLSYQHNIAQVLQQKDKVACHHPPLQASWSTWFVSALQNHCRWLFSDLPVL